MNDRKHLGKFDSKNNKSIFLGYSNNNRAYRMYNMRTYAIVEYAKMVVDDFNGFADFSKEEKITCFAEEAMKESAIL